MNKAAIDLKEFKRGWQILVLSFIGVATSASVMPLYGFGTLLIPLQEAFHWPRSELMATTSFSAFGAIFSSQLAGWLNRYYGIKPVAISSFVGLSLAFILLSQLDRFGNSIWVLYTFFGLLSFAGVGTLQVTWTQLVNTWFDKNRGLALAIILSGSGFAGIVLPPLITLVVDEWSWRAGFLLLAMLPLLITFPLALCWLKSSPEDNQQLLELGGAQGSSSAELESDIDNTRLKLMLGVSFSEGIRSWRYWIINISMMLVSAAIIVMVVNAVPMLIDKGYTAQVAAQLFSMFGLSLVLGRVAVGYLVDRLWAPGIAFVVIAFSALGCLLFALGSDNTSLLMVSIFLIGVGAGAEFDLAAFLVARYFGMRDYARLFGLQMSFISAGICVAPALVAFMYQETGSYQMILNFNVGLLLIGATILLLLGRYPVFTPAIKKTEQ